jgi:hypothetical protein
VPVETGRDGDSCRDENPGAGSRTRIRAQQQEGTGVREDVQLCTRRTTSKGKTPGAEPARNKAGRGWADQDLESVRNAEEVP